MSVINDRRSAVPTDTTPYEMMRVHNTAIDLAPATIEVDSGFVTTAVLFITRMRRVSVTATLEYPVLNANTEERRTGIQSYGRCL